MSVTAAAANDPTTTFSLGKKTVQALVLQSTPPFLREPSRTTMTSWSRVSASTLQMASACPCCTMWTIWWSASRGETTYATEFSRHARTMKSLKASVEALALATVMTALSRAGLFSMCTPDASSSSCRCAAATFFARRAFSAALLAPGAPSNTRMGVMSAAISFSHRHRTASFTGLKLSCQPLPPPHARRGTNGTTC